MYISTEIYEEKENKIPNLDGTVVEMDSIASNIIGSSEWMDLFETILSYVDDDLAYLLYDPRHMAIINHFIHDFFSNEFPVLYDDNRETVSQVIAFAIDYYFSFIAVPRSSLRAEIPEQCNVVNIVEHLIRKNSHEQKTDEWHRYRHNLITASSAWKALDSLCNINSFILGKCKPVEIRKQGSYNLSTPFHWGVKYEPVSVLLYEYLYEAVITDFGCIQHDEHKFLGASPDGINTKHSHPLFGRMLEIKNIVNRDITGIPKKEYWVQMQIQMEVCNLDSCDFLECRFQEYTLSEDFFADGSFTRTSTGLIKGCFLQFCIEDRPFYAHPPFQCSEQEYKIWRTNCLADHTKKEFIKTIYWRLDEYSCVLVKRNKHWFNSVLSQLKTVWDTIQYERTHGYEHRESKKRKIEENVVFSII